MKSIIDLPAHDLYPIIFRNLSIDDLFNCRLVNKQFKYFSDHTDGINKLIIGQPNLYEYNQDDYYWYYNNKSIEDQEIISLKCFRSIKLLSIFNLDKNLKYLKIYDRELKLKEILNFINLESIEFGRYYNNIYDQKIINLNNLKVFISNDQSIKLDTPKLEKIKFKSILKIRLKNPETIKHLITNDYYANKLTIFKNLEIMELRDIFPTTDNFAIDNLLIIFKNLKQFKIDSKVSLTEKRIENSLIKIFNDKIKLKREIDIYLNGVKMENIDTFHKLNANSWLKFSLNNYDLLDLNVSFIQRLCYEKLEECVNNIRNDLPTSFFDKFSNVNNVWADNLNDVNDFNWFLNNLKYLVTLTIYSRVSLDEVFYNNLPNTIRYLTIYNKKDINFDFILKLSKLIHFDTSIDKDLFDLAFTSLLKLKYLNRFEFYFKRTHVNIRKNDKDFYLNDEIYDTKLDYNQLIVKCNEIRSKRINF